MKNNYNADKLSRIISNQKLSETCITSLSLCVLLSIKAYSEETNKIVRDKIYNQMFELTQVLDEFLQQEI